MNLFVTWFLITTSVKSQLNDIIALPDFSFSNLLLSNELPYIFTFSVNFRVFPNYWRKLPNTVMCELGYIRHLLTLDNIYRPKIELKYQYLHFGGPFKGTRGPGKMDKNVLYCY